jgi:hypothetical protein
MAMKRGRIWQELWVGGRWALLILVKRLIARPSRSRQKQEVTLRTTDGILLTTWVYV